MLSVILIRFLSSVLTVGLATIGPFAAAAAAAAVVIVITDEWTLAARVNCCVCNASQAANKKQKYERISEKKMSTPVEVLCKVCLLSFL